MRGAGKPQMSFALVTQPSSSADNASKKVTLAQCTTIDALRAAVTLSPLTRIDGAMPTRKYGLTGVLLVAPIEEEL